MMSPMLPVQLKPVLLGSVAEEKMITTDGRTCKVKNTFIDGEEDATPVAHQRRFTCPEPPRAEEEESTPSAGDSLADTISSVDSKSSNGGVHQMSFFPQASEEVYSVRNTFIDAPGDWTPAVHRRNKTCPAEAIPEDSSLSDDDLGDFYQKCEGAGSSPPANRLPRLSNKKLGDLSPQGRSRGAYATEDLREEFAAEYPNAFFPSDGCVSPGARRTRAEQATEELRELLFAGSERKNPPPHLPPPPQAPEEFSPTASPMAPAYSASSGQSPISPGAESAGNAENPFFPSCPPGYVPVATAAAAVAAASSWPMAFMAHPVQQMAVQQMAMQQMAMGMVAAASMSPYPFGMGMPTTTMPPMMPPPNFPPAGMNFPGVPVADASSPTGAVPPGLITGDAFAYDEQPDGSKRGGRGRRQRLWAHIYLHMQADGFDLVPRLIGRGGCNMRKIAEATDAKVRIRGRGSGHLEMDGKSEAPTPLMVAVTTDHADPVRFRQAIEMTLKELKAVEGRYNAFRKSENLDHTGPCYSIGILQQNAMEALGDLLNTIPQSGGAKPCITKVQPS